jgi:hypothetical protein
MGSLFFFLITFLPQQVLATYEVIDDHRAEDPWIR